MQIQSQKLLKFNIHRHYSCPTICKTSKKFKFHKLSFQKMFRNLNIKLRDDWIFVELILEICFCICTESIYRSADLRLVQSEFQFIFQGAPWGGILTRPVTEAIKDSQLLLYKMLNAKYFMQNTQSTKYEKSFGERSLQVRR